MGRKTIKLPEDEYEKHNERRKDYGLSWAEYINGEAPAIVDEIKPVIKEVVREELETDA